MDTTRPRARWAQVSLRTLALSVAVAASFIAQATWFRKVPDLQRSPILAISGCLITFGLVLPALWVGIVRRLSLDGLLTHIAAVAGLSRFLFAAEGNPRVFYGLLFVSGVALVLVPSVAWYLAASLDPGPDRDRTRRWAAGYTKNAIQVGFGILFFMGLSVVVVGGLS